MVQRETDRNDKMNKQDAGRKDSNRVGGNIAGNRDHASKTGKKDGSK